jgi:hypothetical protein
MSSESFCQQKGSSSSAILLLYSPQRLETRGLTLIGVLLTLAGGEGLQINRTCILHMVIIQRCMTCEASNLVFPVSFVRRKIRVITVYIDYSVYRRGQEASSQTRVLYIAD